MMRMILAAVAACATFASSANAQLSISAALSPRRLPNGVSIPAIPSGAVSRTDLGCPGEVTSHTNTWYVDQVNGHTQSGGGTGSSGAPWDSLQALTGNGSGTPTTGYTQILLSTAPGGNGSSPVKPGDLVIVNTGSYGAVTLGASQTNPALAISNSPALTIQAGSGQTPLLTNLFMNNASGFHIEGLKVQSLNSGNYLVGISGGYVGVTTSDVILENMDISSASVATADTWTPQSVWISNASLGVAFISADYGSTGATTAFTCASIINPHIYVVHGHSGVGNNGAALVMAAGKSLIKGAEIDHFDPHAIYVYESDAAIENTYVHDFVETGEGDQHFTIWNAQTGIVTPSLHQSNIYISQTKVIESIDPSQTFQAAANGFLNSDGDITNFVLDTMLLAGGGETAIGCGNIHNAAIMNNSIMGGSPNNPGLNCTQGHAGGTGPIGIATSNVAIFNNIAQTIGYWGPNVQAYGNIATGVGYNSYTYVDGWNFVYEFPTTGSITSVPTASGQSNILDGKGQADVFTTVAGTTTAFPMNPQPNWTPVSGSIAKTLGGFVLVPPITDYNGTAFAPPYSIGALN